MTLKDILKDDISREEFYNRVKKRRKSIDNKRGMSFKQKGEYVSKNFPEYINKTIDEAEMAMKGLFVLPGTGGKPYFVGNPPDWNVNAVDNNEYLFHLNRMNYWKPLLEAYTVTGNKKYAQKVIDELYDWIKKCPRPEIDKNPEDIQKSFSSVTPWRSLEAGIRTYKNWPWVIEHLMDTEFMTPEVLEKYAISVYGQCEVLMEICPLLWPEADHNHYLMENLGLLTTSCMFPEFDKSDEWKSHAIKQLERCCRAQLTKDGGQIEGCPSYHNGCVFWFALSLMIAKENDFSFSDEYVKRVEKCIDYSIYSFRPSGTGVTWGDSKANKQAIIASLYGYLAFDRLDWLSFMMKLTSYDEIFEMCIEHAWRAPNMQKFFKDMSNLKTFKSSYSLPTMSWQHELKQVLMRTDWSKQALSVFFACRTPIKNMHAHIDPMGFDFVAFGKPLIVDPGVYTYRDDKYRKMFKSAAWHNTLTIDYKDHFEYIASWKYGPQKHGEITKAEKTENIMYAQAMHVNFEPAVHRRIIAIIDSTFLLILDNVSNMKKDSSVQIYYHMDCPKAVLDLDNKCAYTDSDDVNVAIYYTDNLKGQMLCGKVSDKIDHLRNSVRVCLLDDSKDHTTRNYATVIVPYKSGADLPKAKNLTINEKDNEVTCEFILANKKYHFVWNEEAFYIDR